LSRWLVSAASWLAGPVAGGAGSWRCWWPAGLRPSVSAGFFAAVFWPAPALCATLAAMVPKMAAGRFRAVQAPHEADK